ncbi:hypothetical protein ACNO5E_11390 [Vibrio parahaemolyticus]
MKVLKELELLYSAQKRLIELYQFKVDVLEGKNQRLKIEDIDEDIQSWSETVTKVKNELEID